MGERRAVVRSYQRLFVPDRRIYAIDGRTIPLPGGVPLRWLGYAAATVMAIMLAGGLHPVLIAVGAGVGYWSAARLGRRRDGARRALIVAVALTVAGLLAGTIDWPLRLVVIPAVTASALTQIAPDGRSAVRYLLSLARVRVAGRRRAGRALPAAGHRPRVARRVAVKSDTHRSSLGRARITGPCRLRFADPVLIRRRWRRRVLVPVAGERARLGVMVDTLQLDRGDRVEVRP
jgi:hypothetical protein